MEVFRGNERVRGKWKSCLDKNPELTSQQLFLIPKRVKKNTEEDAQKQRATGDGVVLSQKCAGQVVVLQEESGTGHTQSSSPLGSSIPEGSRKKSHLTSQQPNLTPATSPGTSSNHCFAELFAEYICCPQPWWVITWEIVDILYFRL